MEESRIYLRQSVSGEILEAELWDDISDEFLTLWRDSWVPPIQSIVQQLQKRSVPFDKWPQDLHWDWHDKATVTRNLLAFQRFAITCGGALQGLMLVNLSKMAGRIPEQIGKDLAYIEFLSTAPWNRPEISGTQHFSGVGRNMIRAAIELSRNEGFRGRIGLHSLSQAARFYREACGMTDLGPDISHQNLIYFEMTSAQADIFCQPP